MVEWKAKKIKSLFLLRTRLISVYVTAKWKVDEQLGPCNHIEAVLMQIITFWYLYLKTRILNIMSPANFVANPFRQLEVALLVQKSTSNYTRRKIAKAS